MYENPGWGARPLALDAHGCALIVLVLISTVICKAYVNSTTSMAVAQNTLKNMLRKLF